MDNLTRQIADFAAKLSYEKLPQKVVSAATRFLIDTLACAIAAANCQSAQIGLRLARGAAPLHYPGRILFHRETSTAKSAALVNTAMIRNLDFND
jgi:2-methylcitrate dehydratase